MSEPKIAVVTIDGPAGVGKSTISRRIAAELGYTYLDTGAMYRAVAYSCEKAGLDIHDESAITALLDKLDLQLLPPLREKGDVRVLLAGKDISVAIRTPAMGMLASKVSALPLVRTKLTAMQQAMGKQGDLVAEGRDTGTVVFPNAAWKFYLDAAPEERARRRVDQLQENGQQVDAQEILAQIIKRDKNDQQRTIAPLSMAEDAALVDTSVLSIDEVVVRMLDVIR